MIDQPITATIPRFEIDHRNPSAAIDRERCRLETESGLALKQGRIVQDEKTGDYVIHFIPAD